MFNIDRFVIKNQLYVLIALNTEPQYGEDLYFAKEDILDDGTSIVRSIESNEEYKMVIETFESLIQKIGVEKSV